MHLTKKIPAAVAAFPGVALRPLQTHLLGARVECGNQVSCCVFGVLQVLEGGRNSGLCWCTCSVAIKRHVHTEEGWAGSSSP